eukprot:1195385-Prorocentrum_minimum.AAC.5
MKVHKAVKCGEGGGERRWLLIGRLCCTAPTPIAIGSSQLLHHTEQLPEELSVVTPHQAGLCFHDKGSYRRSSQLSHHTEQLPEELSVVTPHRAGLCIFGKGSYRRSSQLLHHTEQVSAYPVAVDDNGEGPEHDWHASGKSAHEPVKPYDAAPHPALLASALHDPTLHSLVPPQHFHSAHRSQNLRGHLHALIPPAARRAGTNQNLRGHLHALVPPAARRTGTNQNLRGHLHAHDSLQPDARAPIRTSEDTFTRSSPLQPDARAPIRTSEDTFTRSSPLQPDASKTLKP